MADRVVVMNAGIAEQIGPPLEVYRNPASLFVAGFIGSPPMNFVDPGLLPDLSVPGAKTLGVRPEHLTFTNEDAGMLKGRVAFCEALGADTLVHVRMPDQTIMIVRSEGEPMETGAVVGVQIAPDSVMRFGDDGRVLSL